MAARTLASTAVAAAVLVIAMHGAHAAEPAASSACPPVIGERDNMLEVLRTTGMNAQIARRCGINAADVQRKASADVAVYRRCLSERNILQPEIDTALVAGGHNGDAAYDQSGNKDLVCQTYREQFAP